MICQHFKTTLYNIDYTNHMLTILKIDVCNFFLNDIFSFITNLYKGNLISMNISLYLDDFSRDFQSNEKMFQSLINGNLR